MIQGTYETTSVSNTSVRTPRVSIRYKGIDKVPGTRVSTRCTGIYREGTSFSVKGTMHMVTDKVRGTHASIQFVCTNKGAKQSAKVLCRGMRVLGGVGMDSLKKPSIPHEKDAKGVPECVCSVLRLPCLDALSVPSVAVPQSVLSVCARFMP